MTVLYITQNGITDHIGRSQVAPYVLGLAGLGVKMHVLSAEKPGREALIERYQRLFDEAGVRWTRVPYHVRPPVFGQVWTQALMGRKAASIVRREGVRLVHCRSFPPAVIGYRLKRALGVKFIFDFRDFYADGGLQKTRGLRWLAFRRMKQLEGPMIRAADKVVCLTERAREVLTDWYLADIPDAARRFQVIPCCADFKHFDLARVTPAAIERAKLLAGIREGDVVLLYLGSLGPDYLLPEMMSLFRQLLLVQPSARFLFVSNNGEDLVMAQCALQGIDPARISFVAADRDDVPAMIGLADFSVLFYRDGLRSVGCSPTKLAELFACNVPAIANSGVGDLDEIMDLERNGSVVVQDFREETLFKAAETVLVRRAKGGPDIRTNSCAMDLDHGIAHYAAVYQELLGEEVEESKEESVNC